MTKGSYCLIMKLDKDKSIQIGGKPIMNFPKGFYCYVGSGMNNLEKRIERHKSKEKKLHWHIDWFIKYAKLKDVKILKSNKKKECLISREIEKIADLIPMNGFGSSDCNICKAHLYYFNTNPEERIEKVVKKCKNY